MKRKRLLVCTLLLMVLTMAFGCGKKKEESSTVQIPKAGEGTFSGSLEYNFEEGKVKSLLTGELIDEKVAQNRIVTCMINNISDAMPQSGISKADIVYECVVEGGITRLMGVFQDYKKIEKLGPVRSARHYYVDFSHEYDAVYAHVGQTKYAVSEMKSLKTEELSGLSALGNIVFFRDNTRVAPHNAYTDGKKIVEGIKQAKFDKKITISEPRFDFNVEPVASVAEDAKDAKTVKLTFNAYSHPYFKYNEKKQKYYRWQYNTEHIDDQTGKQLCYENIIVQFTGYSNKDHNGYQEVDLIGNGDGFYISEGKYVPITWEKSKKADYTTYYTADGKELKVNPGKTWISIFPIADKDGVEIK